MFTFTLLALVMSNLNIYLIILSVGQLTTKLVKINDVLSCYSQVEAVSC